MNNKALTESIIIESVSDFLAGMVLESTAKGPDNGFNPQQPRDEHGQWASSGGGGSEGSGEVYHGTSEGRAEKIIKEGLKPLYCKEVYATLNFRDAALYAVGNHDSTESIAIVIAKKSTFKDNDSGGRVLTSKKPIKPENIIRVEIYKFGDLINYTDKTFHGDENAIPRPVPIKIIEGKSGKAVEEVIYLVPKFFKGTKKLIGLGAFFLKGPDNGFNPQQPRDEHGMWSSGSGDVNEAKEIEQSFIKSQIKSLMSKLKKEDVTNLKNYVYADAHDVNRSLRDGTKLEGRNVGEVSSLDKSFSLVNPVENDVIVYRAITNKSILPKVGEIFSDNGYISVSQTKEAHQLCIDEMKSVYYGQKVPDVSSIEIVVPRGSKMVPLQDGLGEKIYSYQKEMLINRGSKFRVESIGKTIKMRLI